MVLEQVGPIAGGPLPEIGHLDDVRQDVIGVVTQQRVAVEQQGRHPRHDHDVEADRTGQTGLDRQPDIERERGNQQFHHHPGRTDQRPVPARTQHRGGRRIDIRHRHEHQQHHTHVVHLATGGTRRSGMPEFVQCLDQGKDDGDQQQVVGLQHTVGQIARQLGPMLRHQHQRRQHSQQPQHRPPTAPQQPPGRDETIQEGTGVPQ